MEDTRQPNGRGAAAMQTLVCTPKNFYPSVLVILVDPIRAAGIAISPATGIIRPTAASSKCHDFLKTFAPLAIPPES
ncbi:MAG: hypothetical protein GY801_27955 [bacterium]|nr:hypothetical protein [bacterium]